MNANRETRPVQGGGERQRRLRGIAAIAALSAACFALSTSAAAKEAKLICAGYTGSKPIQDFQALVKLYDGCSYGFNYSDCAVADGGDLWFTDSSGNLIPHEIDVWNASGESFVWVKIPEIADSSTYIMMHWGEARTAAQTCAATDTWSNYAGVWHMNGTVVDNTPETEPDATGNGLDAVPTSHPNGQTYLKNMTRASTAKVGYARVNKSTVNAYDTCGLKVPSYKDAGIVDNPAQITLGGWFYWDGSNGSNSQTDSGDYLHLFCNQGTFTINEGTDNDQPAYDTISQTGRFNIQKNAGTSALQISVDGGNAITIANGTSAGQHKWATGWVHFAFVFDGTTLTVYRNGAQLATSTQSANCVAHSAYGFAIGCKGWRKSNAFRGKYDEVRMFNGAETAERIAANYATMDSPETFLIPDTSIATAEWTGGGNDGSVSNPSNWLCKNALGTTIPDALPDGGTAVTIEGTGLYINVKTTDDFQFATLSIGNCTLGAACDWRGLGASVMSHAAGKTIELNGFGLTIAGLTASATATINNAAAGTPADLTVDVASGECTNNNIAILGNIRFVKDGAGTLYARKTGQTYDGGTHIIGGTMGPSQATNAAGTAPVLQRSGYVFGDKAAGITVEENGTFDIFGNGSLRTYVIRLAGGTFSFGGTLDYGSNETYSGSGITMLTADSRFVVTRNFIFGSSYGVSADGAPSAACNYTDLGGFTLDTTIASGKRLIINHTSGPTNGVFKTSGEGTVHFNHGSHHTMESTSFEVGSALNMGVAITVSNYVARYTGTANTGTAAINVKYAFRPETAKFYGCTMMNGSTMDFSAWVANGLSFPVASGLSSGKVKPDFQAGTVYVKLGMTKAALKTLALSEDPYILKWATTTEPSGTAFEFAADDPAAETGYELVHDETGLKVTPRKGFTVRIAGMESDITIPADWMLDNASVDFDAAVADAQTALETTGANGIKVWQSYFLGLNPNRADSVILCEAAEAAESGAIGLRVKNLSVPEGASGATVKVYLDRMTAPGGEWIPQGEGVPVSSGGVVLNGTLAAGSDANRFRVRVGIE